MKKQVIMAVFGLTAAQVDALAPQDINALYGEASAIETDVCEAGNVLDMLF